MINQNAWYPTPPIPGIAVAGKACAVIVLPIIGIAETVDAPICIAGIVENAAGAPVCIVGTAVSTSVGVAVGTI